MTRKAHAVGAAGGSGNQPLPALSEPSNEGRIGGTANLKKNGEDTTARHPSLSPCRKNTGPLVCSASLAGGIAVNSTPLATFVKGKPSGRECVG